jgi:adenylate cyclase
MADIFVSYARQDKARVAPLVAALERQGWSVWWDPAIVPGQEFDDRIAEEIDKASAVVVVWTPASVASRWVRGEAREAADRGILIPLRFDAARLPIDARAVHTTDLDGWNGDPNHAIFREIAAALSGLLKNVARSEAAAPSEHPASVCVLPFLNMSGDPEQEYFSDGLSEELLNQLAQMRGLRVAARTSSFAFKGQNPDLKIVSEKLGVAHVLEGSVRKAGNRLRITAQLVSCAHGYHLWSNTFARELDDVFQIQEDIARAVADALKITLGIGESTLVTGSTKNVEAYDLYLRAQDFARQFGMNESQRALALYRRAIELDSGFALAWVGLGFTWANMVIRTPENASTALQEMDTAFRRAAALVPGSVLAHSAEGFRLTCHRDWSGAEAAYRAALACGSANALSALPGGFDGYTFFLSNVGRADDALRQVLNSRSLDPLSLAVSSILQYALDTAERHQEADIEYQRSVDLTGDHSTSDWWALLRAWARGDSPAQVIERTRQHLSTSQGLMPFYSSVLEVVEDPERALALIRPAFVDPAYQDASRMSILGHWAAHFGDTALALAAMRRAFAELGGIAIGNIWFPEQKQMRRLPGFKTLVRDLGIYDYWRKSGHWGDFAKPVGADDFEIIR